MDHILLCDFTMGAYVKMALSMPGLRPTDVALYSCPSKAAFEEAVTDFLKSHDNPRLVGAALSSRGWERRGVLQLPEKGITIVREEMRELLDVKRINLVNNFVARALAIPRLRDDERQKVCGDEAVDEQVIAVLGPHHGLGLAALAPDGVGGWTAMPCEGGHSDLPCTTSREWAVYEVLRSHYGHVAREFALSLDGLVEVYQALSQIDKQDNSATTPEEIIALASIGDACALEAVDLCVGWLAAMAADIGLILGARGGIYLTGDLMDLLGDLFKPEVFCRRYLNKGRLKDYVAEIPVYKVQAQNLEIIGLATLFD